MEGHTHLQEQAGTLPQRLKSATRELHARAERSGAMADLLAGTIKRGAYVALLANLHAIYAAMEAALDVGPACARLFASLARRAALEADLRSFGGATQTLTAGTLDYVDRLQALRSAGTHRLWAHVYVRYLGDLHGGQILASRVRTLFALVNSTRFYDFGSEDDVNSLRSELRSVLAALELDAVQADETVAEAIWAFEAHCRIFEEIRATT